MRCTLIAVMVLLLIAPSFSQDKSDSTKAVYIDKFPDKFFFWPLLRKRTLSFDIKNRNTNSQSVKYKPNNPYTLGFGVYLFEVTAEFSFALPINEKSSAAYGNTDVREFHANILGSSWGINAYSQRYGGFYYPDRSKPSGDIFIKRPDIELHNLGINGIYAFNSDRFSLKAAYNFSEQQLKSMGSFIITGNLNTFSLDADSAIVTQSSVQQGSTSDFQQMNNTQLSVAGGYTYTLVYKSFFINGALSIGPAHNWVNYKTSDGKTRYDLSVNTFNDVRFAVGYNSDRLFGGISYVIQSRNNKFENVDITNTTSFLKFMFGYRFNEVGILKKRAKDYIPKAGRG